MANTPGALPEPGYNWLSVAEQYAYKAAGENTLAPDGHGPERKIAYALTSIAAALVHQGKVVDEP